MDDDLAKRRLWLLTALRLGAFAPFLLGIAIMYTGLLRPGGWPQVGAAICIVSVLASVGVTYALRMKWRRERS